MHEVSGCNVQLLTTRTLDLLYIAEHTQGRSFPQLRFHAPGLRCASRSVYTARMKSAAGPAGRASIRVEERHEGFGLSGHFARRDVAPRSRSLASTAQGTMCVRVAFRALIRPTSNTECSIYTST